MIGYRPNRYWYYCWKYTAPVVTVVSKSKKLPLEGEKFLKVNFLVHFRLYRRHVRAVAVFESSRHAFSALGSGIRSPNVLVFHGYDSWIRYILPRYHVRTTIERSRLKSLANGGENFCPSQFVF